MLRPILVTLVLLCAPSVCAAEKVVKETFGSGGRIRTYYVFVSDKARASGSAPLLVLLHGSGRDGRSLIDKWEPLAKKEGIILVAPDALNRQGWHMRDDGPDFFYALVEMVRIQLDADPRRLFLFGHSAGAIHSLAMALLESEYFAGVAVHAGALTADHAPFMDRAPRKIPISIWVGTNDPLFPLPAVRATRDALNSRGFSSELIEIKGHTHWYYDRAPEINKDAWTFLQKARLAEDPKYQLYEIPKQGAAPRPSTRS